jgi:hypothetical protein
MTVQSRGHKEHKEAQRAQSNFLLAAISTERSSVQNFRNYTSRAWPDCEENNLLLHRHLPNQLIVGSIKKNITPQSVQIDFVILIKVKLLLIVIKAHKEPIIFFTCEV